MRVVSCLSDAHTIVASVISVFSPVLTNMPKQENTPDERRACPRYQCDIPIKILAAEGEFHGIAINLSLCGMLALMEQQDVIGCDVVVNVTFRLPERIQTLSLDAYLRRNHENILGLTFLHMTEDDTSLVQQFLRGRNHLEVTLNKLNEIGIALSSSVSLDHLLEMIVVYAKELTHADGGSLYLRVDQRHVRFAIVRNDSLGIAIGGLTGTKNTLPMVPLYIENGSPDFRTVVSSCILRRKLLSIDDVYDTKRYDFSQTHAFDTLNHYRTKSCLTVPVMAHGKDPVGAIQLINAIDENTGEIIPFSKENEHLMESIASQAMIAISNHKLNAEIKEQLDFYHGLIEINHIATSDDPWKARMAGVFDQIVSTFPSIQGLAGCVFIYCRDDQCVNGSIIEYLRGLTPAQADYCRAWSLHAQDTPAQPDRPFLLGHYAVPIASEFGYFGSLHVMRETAEIPDPLCRFLQDVGPVLAGVLSCERSKVVIAESEHYLEAILDNALDGIIVMDESGKVNKCNAAIVDMFGYAREDWFGMSLNQVITLPSVIQSFSAAFDQDDEVLHDPHNKQRLRCQGRRADGKTIDIDIGLVASRWWDESRVTVFLRDVTAEQKFLQSLKDTLGAAEEASKMKSAFLANMSHEIRSPLNAIIGMTDLILTGSLPREEEISNLQMVLNAGLSLLDLINDILDLSKIEAGHFVLECIPFDLCGRVEDACSTMAIKAHQKSLDLFCDIDWNLPETLLGDPMRLKQILINLINNAIKFTASGFVAVRVTIDTPPVGKDSDCVLHISVTDTGIGISADKVGNPSCHLSGDEDRIRNMIFQAAN